MSRRSSLSFEVVELPARPPRPSRIILKNRGIQLRSDQLQKVRRVVLDLHLDDYDYSANEAIRAGLDWFLSLDIVGQLRVLDELRRREQAAGVGIASVRPLAS